MHILTGCFIWKLSKVNGCRTETEHFRIYGGKAKMCLRGGKFALKNCKQTAENCDQIFDNSKISLKYILDLHSVEIIQFFCF